MHTTGIPPRALRLISTLNAGLWSAARLLAGCGSASERICVSHGNAPLLDILRSPTDAGLKWSSYASRIKQTIMCHYARFGWGGGTDTGGD